VRCWAQHRQRRTHGQRDGRRAGLIRLRAQPRVARARAASAGRQKARRQHRQQVGLAVEQQAPRVARRQRQDAHGHPGLIGLQFAQQRPGQQGCRHIGHHQPEQRLADRAHQALQCMAGRRLRDCQPGRGARQAAVGHHAVKDPQQVQVEGAKADVMPGTLLI